MYRVTARWNKKRNPAIAVGGKATSRAIAPIAVLPGSPAPAAAAEEEEAAQQNAIAVARSAILRVRAPRRRAVALVVGLEVGIAVAEEAEEVRMEVLAVVVGGRRATRAEG